MTGDRTERVAAVLARLPVLPDRRPSIRDEARALVNGYALLQVTAAPRFRSAPRKAARALADLRDHCDAAADILGSMPSEAHAALDAARAIAEARRKVNESRGRFRLRDRVPDHELFAEALAAFAADAERARRTLESGPALTPARKANDAAAGLARLAAGAYTRLTGARPTIVTGRTRGHGAGGAFLELVAALFEALGEQAKPESYARAAVRSLGDSKTTL